MRPSYLRRGVLLALTLAAAACTSSSAPPTTPTTTSLLTPQVTGVFQGTMTLASIGGGNGPLPNAGAMGCVHDAFQTAFPKDNTASLVIKQDPTDPSGITARLTSASTGLACTYQGVIGSGNSLVLDAPAGSNCTDALSLAFACSDPTTGAPIPVGMQLVGSSLTATFDGWPINVQAVRGTIAMNYTLGDDTPIVVSLGGQPAPATGLPAAPPLVPPFVLAKH